LLSISLVHCAALRDYPMSPLAALPHAAPLRNRRSSSRSSRKETKFCITKTMG